MAVGARMTSRLISEGRSSFEEVELHQILGSILSRPQTWFGLFAPANGNLASMPKHD